MKNVKIIGAGSIGNHLSFACRQMNWNVWIEDIDQEALKRTKEQIYPGRYGSWDSNIELCLRSSCPEKNWDLIIIGTPPESHTRLAIEALEKETVKAILIEKPLCTPALNELEKLMKILAEKNTYVFVGYNHTLNASTKYVAELLHNIQGEECLTIRTSIREHWQGIFNAHPWLNGPQDSYLGFYEKGGGACCEHSHGINIWQYFAHVLDRGRIIEVSAVCDFIKEDNGLYDRLALISVKTEKGLIGHITQDVITSPASKKTEILIQNGSIIWQINKSKDQDVVEYAFNNKHNEKTFLKTRIDDFNSEIEHVDQVLEGKIDYFQSPITLARGIETMLVIAAVFKSVETKSTVRINYEKNISNALEIA